MARLSGGHDSAGLKICLNDLRGFFPTLKIQSAAYLRIPHSGMPE